MTISFRPAKRENVGLLIGLAGASGSGKSYSALRLARGLAGDEPFAYLDTEARRALHYADDFQPWHHAEIDPPFRPATYLEAIKAAEKAGYKVIVVDSASHEYSGPGGLHDWHSDILDKQAGNDLSKRQRLSAGAWAEPKLAHARFVGELLQVHAHLIICFRARQAIEMVKENGKTVIRPTEALDSFEGWLIDTEHKRMPLPFELTCSFLMLPDHPGIPRPIKLPEPLKQFVPLDKPITEETGVALAKWAAGEGQGQLKSRVAAPPADPLTQETLSALLAARMEAEVKPEWIREHVQKAGVEDLPARVTVPWLKGNLSEPQGKQLLSDLNAVIDERNAVGTAS
jgi:hypothetical protein